MLPNDEKFLLPGDSVKAIETNSTLKYHPRHAAAVIGLLSATLVVLDYLVSEQGKYLARHVAVLIAWVAQERRFV